MKHFLAATAVAVGTATALAAPVHADDQLDQTLLQALKDAGVPIKSDEQALKLAHSTCDLLTSGGSVEDALKKIKLKMKWSTETSTTFGGYAVQAYCPDALPKDE